MSVLLGKMGMGMNEHDWSERLKSQYGQGDAFTEPTRTNGERSRNDPRSCKTLLRVAETQLAHLAADGDEASAKHLWRHVERIPARAAQRDMAEGGR